MACGQTLEGLTGACVALATPEVTPVVRVAMAGGPEENRRLEVLRRPRRDPAVENNDRHVWPLLAGQ